MQIFSIAFSKYVTKLSKYTNTYTGFNHSLPRYSIFTSLAPCLGHRAANILWRYFTNMFVPDEV